MFDVPRVQLIVMVLVAVVAGVVRGFAGFGAGLVMVPALTLLMGPVIAVPTVVLLEVIAALQLVPGAFRLVRWPTIGPLGLAACVAIPLGGLALASLDPLRVQQIISVIVLVFVAVLWTGWRYGREPTLPVVGATGLASGFLTGLAGVGGPPVILFFLSGPGAAPHVRASLICYFAITQVFALLTYAVGGVLVTTVFWRALILAPAFLGGAYAGTRLFGKVDEGLFRRLTLILLAFLGVAGLILGSPEG